MPTSMTPASGQDWAPVNVGKGTLTKPNAVPQSARSLSAAKDAGLVVTEKK